MEIGQAFVPTRQPSMSDLTSNTGGALLGVLAGIAAGKFDIAPRLVWRHHLAQWKAWLFLFVALAVSVWPVYPAGYPNAFSLTPFATMIEGDGPANLWFLFTQTVTWGFAIWLFAAAGKKLPRATLTVAAAVLVSQLVQIAIRGKHPGVTAPVLALLAGYLIDAITEPQRAA